MADINRYESILTEKLKQIIRDEGLVKSGALVDSISVKISESGISVDAEDYYQYLDEEHGLTDKLIESQEFNSFIEEFIIEQINNELK